jgi:hypothetical protein
MMGIEKDLTLRELIGLSLNFDSAPYKCISAKEDPEKYRIRHSFAFDSKLCNYVIQPLLTALRTSGFSETEDIYDILGERTRKWVRELPHDFFPPNGRWYFHRKVLLTHEREYFSRDNPLLR